MDKHEKLVQLSERDFCVSCIVSDKVCTTILPYVELKYFEVNYTKIVVKWILDFYKEFKVAPKEHILSLYRLHCEEIEDASLQETVLVFLQKIVKNIDEKVNEDFLLAQCRDFLEYRKLVLYVEDLEACLDVRDMEKARAIQANYRKVDVTKSSAIDIFDTKDKDKIEEALTHVDDELFTLPGPISGALGKVHRNDFIAILAGPKAGKTWALIWIAYMASMQGLKVVFVSCEMTEPEVLRRYWAMALGVKSQTIDNGLEFTTSKLEPDENDPGSYKIVEKKMKIKKNSSISVAEGQKKLKLLSRGGRMRVETHPRFSVSVEKMKDDVRELCKQGFVPDVVVVDYADILKPSVNTTVTRDQLDSIWKSLAAFAQEMHVALFTASQTNRAGLSGNINAENVAEDMRKLAHTVSFAALERTPAMKKKHLARLKNLMSRNGASDEPCVFSTAFEIGQFVYGKPVWNKDVNWSDDDD